MSLSQPGLHCETLSKITKKKRGGGLVINVVVLVFLYANGFQTQYLNVNIVFS